MWRFKTYRTKEGRAIGGAAHQELKTPVNDQNFPYTIQVYLGLWDESDHFHGLCRSHAMLDIRWNIEYVTLLEIRLLVINLADALAT